MSAPPDPPVDPLDGVPWQADDPARLLVSIAAGDRARRLLHVERFPARGATSAELPEWTDPALLAALTGAGIPQLWAHQREAAERLRAGEHVVISTGTASGKSLGFLLPVLTSVLAGRGAPSGRGATALYLAPTKALAHDQLTRVEALALPGVRVAAYDGDTPPEERRWVRDHAAYVLTNPDLLHHSLLPGHERWAPFLRALRYVVVDECHIYRGVFGSHVALALRRLRRVAARYRAEPTFAFASATIADPGAHASHLLGMPVRPVQRDGSPRGALTVALWEPAGAESPTNAAAEDGPRAGSDGGPRAGSDDVPLAEPAGDLTPKRRSAVAGVQTVAFARSRVGAEVIASVAARDSSGYRRAVAAYRGGYLPEERRAVERDLREGTLRGLAATTALELGINISGLDAVVLAGWPGTLASFWQQVGRAGRTGRPALAVLIGADDPLDRYLMGHPEAIFQRPVEAAVVDPENPHLLAPHLLCAAAELPLTPVDLELFGVSARGLVDRLVADRVLRMRPTGWYWPRPDRPSGWFSLRGIGRSIRIVERSSGRVVGLVDEARADHTVHAGAVHLHQGATFVVSELDLEAGHALVVAGDPGWSTQARSISRFDLGEVRERRQHPDLTVAFGEVTVHSQVVSFLRRGPSGEVIGEHRLDLPERTLATTGVWWTLPEAVLTDLGLEPRQWPGALHAAEHALIGMLPLVATADRWDVGGVSTAFHPDTGLPTVLVYDGHPGGAGFAERGYAVIGDWVQATLDTVRRCDCEAGCPGCVQSPKCGNGNSPLDKAGAIVVLAAVVSRLGLAEG